MPLLQTVDTVVQFVPDIERAAKWYATLFEVEVEYENPSFAFIRAPGVTIGFHPADAKCPGGVGGTTVYWTVASLTQAVSALEEMGARLLRGPGVTSLGDSVALLVDPFGCTIGLQQRTSGDLA
jgi:predicted enzyme related to lactoylglutathione lyase